VSQEPVTREDVVDTAFNFLEPTFFYILCVALYFVVRANIANKKMMKEPFMEELIGITTLALLVVTALMIFCWGFVVYLALEYLKNRGETE